MSQIYQSLTQLVGNTPLLEVSNIEKELGLKARVVVKLEYFNPGGSVKDRVALAMINDAIQGEIEDEFGVRVTGNLAQKIFRPNSLFFTSGFAASGAMFVFTLIYQ